MVSVYFGCVKPMPEHFNGPWGTRELYRRLHGICEIL